MGLPYITTRFLPLKNVTFGYPLYIGSKYRGSGVLLVVLQRFRRSHFLGLTPRDYKMTLNLSTIPENNILQIKFHTVKHSLSYIPEFILKIYFLYNRGFGFRIFLKVIKIVVPTTLPVIDKELS